MGFGDRVPLGMAGFCRSFGAAVLPLFSQCVALLDYLREISGAALNLVGVGVQQIFHPLDHALQFFRLFGLIEYEA